MPKRGRGLRTDIFLRVSLPRIDLPAGRAVKNEMLAKRKTRPNGEGRPPSLKRDGYIEPRKGRRGESDFLAGNWQPCHLTKQLLRGKLLRAVARNSRLAVLVVV